MCGGGKVNLGHGRFVVVSKQFFFWWTIFGVLFGHGEQKRIDGSNTFEDYFVFSIFAILYILFFYLFQTFFCFRNVI